MKTECNNLVGNRRKSFKSFSLILPSGTKYATFLDTDAHDPTYKLSIPFPDGEIRLTCDNFLGDWEEAKQFAREQYKLNSCFSPQKYNQSVTELKLSDQSIKAINYYYSSGKEPAQWVHTVFLYDKGGVKRLIMTQPIHSGEDANHFFINIVKTYKSE